MRALRSVAMIVTILALCGSASAGPKTEPRGGKQWRLLDALPSQSLGQTSENEPNDSCPGEVHSPANVMRASIGTGGDEDWFRFTCTAGDELTIGTGPDGALPTVDTVVELYGSNCSTLLALDDDSGQFPYSSITGFVAPFTGEYHLRVRSFSTTATGSYLLAVACSEPAAPVVCPIQTYVSESVDGLSIDIPDAFGDATGPALAFAPSNGFVVVDVVVGIQVDHTWLGDLVATVTRTDDVTGEERSATLFHRPGTTTQEFGCSSDLVSDGTYFFSSNPELGLEPIGEPCPAAQAVHACYLARDPASPGPFETFVGLPVGGATWEITVADLEQGDTGTLVGWSVHLLTQSAPVSVETRSWGAIKSRYR